MTLDSSLALLLRIQQRSKVSQVEEAVRQTLSMSLGVSVGSLTVTWFGVDRVGQSGTGSESCTCEGSGHAAWIDYRSYPASRYGCKVVGA